ERDLSEEKPAEPLSRVVECCSRALNILRAGESDQPVPQILPLSENEDDKNHDDRTGGEGTNQRRDDGPERLQSAGGRFRDFHLNGLAGSCTGRRQSSARRSAALRAVELAV